MYIKIKKLIFILFFIFSGIGFVEAKPLFHDSNGHEINHSDLANKWIILNFWADWCDACIEEMPELNRFYKDHVNSKVLLFGFNYDQLPMQNLKNAIAKASVSFPVLMEDPHSVWQLESIDVIPVTFILNPQGRVAKKIIGPNTEKSLIDTLETLQKSS